MIILENVTVFKCKHCGKKMFRKHSMEHHEIYCGCNPDNQRVCSCCKHMRRKDFEYSYTTNCGYGENELTGKSNAFFCEKLNSYIYPPFVEGKAVFKNFPEQFEDQIPFKRECDCYEFGFNS